MITALPPAVPHDPGGGGEPGGGPLPHFQMHAPPVLVQSYGPPGNAEPAKVGPFGPEGEPAKLRPSAESVRASMPSPFTADYTLKESFG